jgi:hypothetical protein
MLAAVKNHSKIWHRAAQPSRMLANLTTHWQHNFLFFIDKIDDNTVGEYRKDGSPLDVVSVTEVMPLHLLLHVVKNDNGSHEVNHFSGGQQVQIAPRIASTVAIAASHR